LLSKYGLQRDKDLRAKNHQTYSLQDSNADVYAQNIQTQSGGYRFEVQMKDWRLSDIRLNMGGMHNVENATAAITVAKRVAIADEKIRAAVEAFRGVKRRFEYILREPPGEAGGKARVFIDDYAHHPEELRALITGAKGLFPDLSCTVIFQPHLYSRTRDFADEFAASLDLADQVVLLPLYPARELPVEGVSSRMILDKMKMKKKWLMDKAELLNWIQKEPVGLLITAGAGDIDALVTPIKEILEKKN